MRKFSINGDVRQELPKIEDDSLEEDVKSSSGKVKWEGKKIVGFLFDVSKYELYFRFYRFLELGVCISILIPWTQYGKNIKCKRFNLTYNLKGESYNHCERHSFSFSRDICHCNS